MTRLTASSGLWIWIRLAERDGEGESCIACSKQGRKSGGMTEAGSRKKVGTQISDLRPDHENTQLSKT